MRKYIYFFLFFCITHATYPNIPPIHHEDFIHSATSTSLHSELKRLPSFFSEMYSDLKDTFISAFNILITIPSTLFSHLVEDHAYSKNEAIIRLASDTKLCPQEELFIQERTEFVAPHLAEFTQTDIPKEHAPRIGLCFSGGGFRAMLLTLGFLHGAHDIGLLDSVTYTAGLSGSTWAIAPWIASRKSINDYMETAPSKLSQEIVPIADLWALKHIVETCIEKIAYKQIISTMDIYGAILANILLSEYGTQRFDLGFTHAHAHLDKTYPLPVYSTIIGNNYPYDWIDVTPYELGCKELGGYVPTWAYGRRFSNGVSTDRPVQQTLGYYLAIFGSAFQANVDDAVRHTAVNIDHIVSLVPEMFRDKLHAALHELIESPLSDVRLLPSILRNFTYQHPQCPYHTMKYLHLIDAGIDFNVPIPPLVRPERKVDVIIVYDASASFEYPTELEKAALYCARHGYDFPTIDYSQLRLNAMNVLWDKDNPKAPAVIYFPMLKNELYNECFDPQICTESGYCSTFNMDYTADEIRELSGLSYHTVTQYAPALKTVLREIVEHKQQTHV